MTTLTRLMLSAGLLAASASSAVAVTVADVVRTGEPSRATALDLAYDAEGDFLDAFDGDFSVSVSGALDSAGEVVGTTATDLFVAGDGLETEVAGSLLDAELADGAIDLLYGVTEDAAGDGRDYGGYVLAELALPEGAFLAADGLDQLDDGGTLPVEAEISAAAVPLPGAAPLLTGALLAVGFVRRRARSATRA